MRGRWVRCSASCLADFWIALWRSSWRWLGLVPIAASFVVIQFSTRPDVFIARDALSAAVRGEDGKLVILAARPDEYTTEQWLLRDGDLRDVAAAQTERAAMSSMHGEDLGRADRRSVVQDRRTE